LLLWTECVIKFHVTIFCGSKISKTY